MKKKSIWNNPILIGVAIGIICLYVEYGLELKLFRFIWNVIKAIGSGIWWVLIFRIPVWLILLLLALLILGGIFIRHRRIRKKIEEPKPEWFKYNEDVIDEIKYTWDYLPEDGDEHYSIGNYRAYCNGCNYLLVDKMGGGKSCPKCNNTFHPKLDDVIYSHIVDMPTKLTTPCRPNLQHFCRYV